MGSRRSNPSVKPGQENPIDSNTIRSSSLRDYTTSSPQLRPLGELLGTEALGIDLSRPLDEATFAWIGRVFAEHPVLVFRDQNLGAAELAAFGRWFGSPRMHA